MLKISAAKLQEGEGIKDSDQICRKSGQSDREGVMTRQTLGG